MNNKNSPLISMWYTVCTTNMYSILYRTVGCITSVCLYYKPEMSINIVHHICRLFFNLFHSHIVEYYYYINNTKKLLG